MTRKGLESFLVQLGVVDQAWGVEKGNSKSYSNLAQELSGLQYSLLIAPHESLTTALWVRKIQADQKISFYHWWNRFFYTDRIAKPKQMPEAFRQISLLSNLDLELKAHLAESSKQNWFAESPLLPAPPAWASAKIFSGQPNVAKKIAFFPGSVWETKKWTENGFIELARKYTQMGYQIILMGSAFESDLCQRIQRAVPECENRAGLDSVEDGLKILKDMRAVVCNDSGGQHLAALAGAPVLTIFGPTVLAQGFRPWSDHSATAEFSGLKCRPCGAHGHQQCPLGTHECMKSLSSLLVSHKLDQLLAYSA